MAKNDVVLLDSIVQKSKPQFGAQLDDSELFELFAFDQMLKEYEPSFEELEAGWTDGGNVIAWLGQNSTRYRAIHVRPWVVSLENEEVVMTTPFLTLTASLS